MEPGLEVCSHMEAQGSESHSLTRAMTSHVGGYVVREEILGHLPGCPLKAFFVCFFRQSVLAGHVPAPCPTPAPKARTKPLETKVSEDPSVWKVS